MEIEESKAKKYLTDEKLKASGSVYELVDAPRVRRERTAALLKALAVLRGGAKQAAFGTDVAPKFLVLAGLSCGNPIFNHLFEDEQPSGLVFKTALFKELLSDYADRITTPVFIGMRSGYISNEKELREVSGSHDFERGRVEVRISTPVEAAESIAPLL